MRKTSMIAGMILGLALLLFSPIRSTALTIDLNYVFSGDTPSGAAPWLTATFNEDTNNEDTNGGVQLTLKSLFQNSGEFLAGANLNNPGNSQFGWGFNLNPALNVSSLIITPTGTGTNDADVVLTGTNAFRAGGDGYFDILFAWDQKPEYRFESGETAVYLISGIVGLHETDFNFTSENGGGEGIYRSAAHVQGIPVEIIDGKREGSAWIADGAPVPEPATMFLLGSGLIGVGVFVRRKFKR